MDTAATSRTFTELTTVEFLAFLLEHNIELWSEGDRLRFSAPKEGLDSELRSELIRRKTELLRFLRQAVAADPDGEPITAVDHRLPHPLSFAQESLWLLHRLSPESAAYTISPGFRLRGPLRHTAIERSLGAVVERHAVLRTLFCETPEGPRQVILPRLDLPLPVVDLSSLPAPWREAEASRVSADAARRPFDLQTGPLLRAVLLRLNTDDCALLFSVHHVVFDGWSSGLLVGELLALYESLRRGTPPRLPDLPVQYADFAVWQRTRLAGPVLEQEIDYWRRQLAAPPEPLILPTDRPHPATPSGRGRSLRLSLGGHLPGALQALGIRRSATPFVTLLAGFAALLSRYSGQTDILIGTAAAGRTRREIEPLIGFFVNTLVMRAVLPEAISFHGLLTRLRTTALDAFSHQEAPFERLVEELRPERVAGRNPLFQVMFLLQNAPSAGLSLPGLAVRPFDRHSETAKFDLTLSLQADEALISGALEFGGDLFDPPTAARIVQHFEQLLAAATAEPDRSLSELSWLGEAEAQQLLVEWNATAAQIPQACLHTLIEAQVERSAEAVAVVCGTATLSYRELNRLANRLANRLRARGVGPEVLVGVCAERSLELVVALLAVLKAGGAYVPLDPDYPADRLGFLLRDSGARLVLTQEHLLGTLPERTAEVSVLLLDGPDDDGLGGNEENPASGVGLDNLAYGIYTSGSTGRPKGVLNSHRGIVNRLLWMQLSRGLAADDRVLQKTPYSFDVSVWELFWPLIAGARLVMARPGGHRDSTYLVAALAEHGITTLHFVPSMLQIFLQEPALGRDVAAGRLGRLRRALASGEALGAELVRRFHAQLGGPLGVELHNLYGPTEAAVEVTFWPCRPGGESRGVPIGRPIDNIQIRLLDPAGRPVPVGVAGELCIGGVGVARGYLGRPELTAERFVPDPFAAAGPGARLYRTGDLARHLPGGEIDYLGRLDHQVKIRGVRIELGEIETALGRLPGVAASAVLVHDYTEEDRRLLAFLVPDPGAAPRATELREALRRELPEAMVPSRFACLERMPLTPSGKVDRRALARLADTAATGPSEPGGTAWLDEAAEPGGGEPSAFGEARGFVEEVLAGIWAEVLHRTRVGREESFFDLGGHSLLATLAVSRISDAFGVNVPLRQLFQTPTVASLAGYLASGPSGGEHAPPPLVPMAREAGMPLSFAQQRLWFLDQLEPGSTAYSMPMAAQVSGPLRPPLAEAALNEVVRRHEVLRTTFLSVSGQPFQVITGDLRLAAPVVDLSGLTLTRRDEEADHLTTAEARKPFRLATGPLIRMTLLRLGEELHRVLLTLHHIVADGWSLDLLGDELGTLYLALAEAAPESAARPKTGILPALPIQYADFAGWQQRWLSGDVLAAELAYWQGQLAGAPASLELPTDRPRPPLRTVRGASFSFTLPLAETAALIVFSRRQGATLFMALLASLSSLLGRYGGTEDVTIGAPIAGRNRQEIEPLIGFFVNTLVLRTDLSGEPSVGDLMARTRQTVLSAFAHQELPFERVVEALVPERDLSRTPLFQVMLALQNVPGRPFAVPAVQVQPMAPAGGTAKFDLSLSITEKVAGLACTLEYNCDLFDPTTAVRLSQHFTALLSGWPARPDAPVRELAFLREAEVQQVVTEWNATAAELPRTCLHALVEAQVERSAEAIAVVCDNAALTYRDLNRQANRLAHHLRARGVGPEVLVGVCAERSLELVVALLAVLKAGGAYLPLDLDHPAERLGFLLRDSGVRLVLTQERLLGALPELPAEVFVLLLDAPAGDSPEWSEANPASGVGLDNLAYGIYTSGSTGRPKGVLNSHRGIVNRLLWMQRTRGLAADDRVLQKTPYSFDVSVWELFWPLIAGARLVMARPGGHRDSTYLVTALAEHGITTLHFVASMLQIFLQEPALRRDIAAGRLHRLRRVLASGEALTPELVQRFHTQLGGPLGVELHNLYGPTEAAVEVTFWPCRLGVESWGVPIGRPIDNIQIRLLDPAGRPVPVGVAGELCIGGVGVARGYLGRPELTAERFVPDPFATAWPGARLYRTGDLARHLPGGEIDYLGRLDHQVKIRGVRIELGEIEAALGRLAGVAACAVVTHDVTAEDRRLLAFVVLDPVAAPGVPALREALRRELPEAMVPSRFVSLMELPLTASGKVDRRALARLAAAPIAESSEAHPFSAGDPAVFGGVRSAVEEVMAGIWAEVLRRDRVGREESFFELGGHSLLATLAASRIREVFGVDMPLRQIFQTPTPAALADYLAEAGRTGGEPAPPLVPVARHPGMPLSFAQQRLWFLDQLEPGSAAYHVPMAVRVGGALRPAALAAALGEVVRRHEVLRTTFHSVSGRPRQVIAGELSLPVPVVDLSGLAPARREVEAGRLAAAEASAPFALAQGPLIRMVLLRLAEESHHALATMHHIISDGWSLDILVGELGAFYAALTEPDLAGGSGTAGLPPALPLQYADFAEWQQRWLQGEVLAAELAYWRGQLAGAPASLELPIDRPRPAQRTVRGATLPFTLPSAETAALTAFSRRQGATLFMTLLASLSTLLGRYSRSEDVSVGAPIAGRNRREIEPLIGLFVNTLVMRADLSGDPTVTDLMVRIRQTVLAAFAHQELPFERVVEELVPERDLSRTPLFQVMLALQNMPARPFPAPTLRVEPIAPAGGTAKLDLTLSIMETAGGLSCALEYNRDLFDATTAARLVRHFQRVSAAAVTDPQRPLSELTLLEEAEIQQLAVESNDTASELQPVCLHALIETQAESSGDAIAVTCEDAALSYRELNRQANRLAHRLRAQGVGPEILIGVFAERSLELVVALLAVLKAGGAYVPLDPDYPAERLAFLLRDSRVRLLLTQERLLGTLPELPEGTRPLVLDSAAGGGEERLGAENPMSGAGPDNLAYGIYTSGSTGQPKGAVNTHRGIVNRLLWMQKAYGLAADDRVLQKTPYSFDVSVWEFFWPLIAGARLVMARPGGHRDSAYLVAAVAEQGITTMHFVPSMLQIFLQEPRLGRTVADGGLGRLRRVMASGEALPPELVRRFYAQLGGPLGVELHNLYGPTEAAVDVTFWPCRPGMEGRGVPIGRPIDNIQIHLLDPAERPVPIGLTGELRIGGVGLARGYLGRPELTAERFVPDPFAADGAGSRLYRTGDLARRLAGGEIDYLGRLDHQVKIHGLRIELGEIEVALGSHPGVAEAVVIVQQTPTGPRLAAFFTACQEPWPSAGELSAWLAVSLPAYMVPATWLHLEHLPLTPSGKADRRELARLETASGETLGVPPRTRLELELQRIWEELLPVRPIGVTDNFFKIGGHSLLAIYMMACVRDRLGRDLPVPVLFQAPTIAGLAALLEKEVPRLPYPNLVCLQPEGAKPPFFCMHGAGGNVFYFVELARILAGLGGDRPFYGLQARGLMADGDPLATVGEMAELYLRAVRSVQAAGPYFLGGYSMGGLIANEMARRLLAAGQAVALVAMIDAPADPGAQISGLDRAEVAAYFAGELAIAITAEDLRPLAPDQQLLRVLEAGWERQRIPREFSLADAQRYFRVMETTLAAACAYKVAGPYPGKLQVFNAEETRGYGKNLGWQALAGVDCQAVPGDHRTLFLSPNIEALGRLLQSALDGAEAPGDETAWTT